MEPLVVTLLFAILGRLLKGVTASGAASGWVVAFIFYSVGGRGAFLLLFVVFVLTLAATRAGQAGKLRLGIAENSEGRNAAQVMANLAVASLFMVQTQAEPELVRLLPLWLATVALAETAADTVSSEIGQTLGAPTMLITTFQRTPAGTSGGISLLGTVAGSLAAIVVAVAAQVLVVQDESLFGLTIVAAVSGMFVDSLLGAVLERRGWLGNHSVNLLGTATAAAVALLLV